MNVSRFNFNLINQKDLRKYLTKKMESYKWEFSSSYDATLAHYTYNRKMAFGFSHGTSMKITIKKILFDLGCDFILPFIYFTRKNMDQVLEENSFFFDDSIFYFRSSDGKKEYSDYLVKNSDNIQKIVKAKYKKSNLNFILEKSSKRMAMFEGHTFDLRVYVMVCKIKDKYYTFLYPTIFANFKNDDLNKTDFFKSIGIGKDEEVSGTNPLMKDIYNLIQKTSTVLSNYLEVSSKIFKLEIDMKSRELESIEFQFNLYGFDISINEDKKPILSDIAINPNFGLLDLPQRIIREKIRIYDDILENFILTYSQVGKIDLDKTSFVILNKTAPDVLYRWFISKKIQYEDDETIEYRIESNQVITPQGELLVQNIISENKYTLTNDNGNLNSRIGIKQKIPEKAYVPEKILENYNSALGEEFLINESNVDEINRVDLKDKTIERKINELFEKEKEPGNFLNFATATIPLLGLMYAAKKTYNNINEAKKNKEITDQKNKELTEQKSKETIPLKTKDKVEQKNKIVLDLKNKEVSEQKNKLFLNIKDKETSENKGIINMKNKEIPDQKNESNFFYRTKELIEQKFIPYL